MEYMKSKMQGHYESGNALLEEIEQLKSERDSILAELQKANGIIIDLQHNPPKLAKEFLAEIKAEAIEGFAKALSNTVQIPSGPITRVDYYKAAIRHAIQLAFQYAAKVRQGEQGTWLKDSNVNDGKRQGGEK